MEYHGNIIGKTIIGSNLWRMARKDSDTDIYLIYKEPTFKILNGTSGTKSKHYKHPDENNKSMIIDVAEHEVGHVVEQLLQGNINAILGVLSDLVEESTPEFDELRYITRTNMAKCCYNSIHGLAIGNFKKFIESGKENTLKRRNVIGRSIEFGTRILEYNCIEFKPVSHNYTKKEIPKAIEGLDKAYEVSKLHEYPDETQFRDWLLRVRLI